MRVCGFFAAALFAMSASALAQETRELAELINAYRTSPQTCEGRRMDAAGPLTPEPRLERVRFSSDAALGAALQKAGYGAARVQAIAISGPRSADSAMSMLKQGYCSVLLSPQFAELGVSREANTWRLVLAQPLLSPDLDSWREAGREVLDLVNAARAEPRTCGEERFGKAPPLQWNEKLAQAALNHSMDMAKRKYFRHEGPGGASVRERATKAGYRWRTIGENIATGQGAPKQVVAGWLASPHHCSNIMHPSFSEMGAAYFVNRDSDTAIYWTQVFGAPR